MDCHFYYYVNKNRIVFTLNAPVAFTEFNIIRRQAGFNYLDAVKITYKEGNQEKELKDNYSTEILNGMKFTVERVFE